MKFDAIIVAGGNSVRMGKNKLLAAIEDKPLIAKTAEAFLSNEKIENVIVVTSDEEVKKCLDGVIFAEAGENRSKSVQNGLKKAVSEGVLIHDGARPFVSENLILRVIDGVIRWKSAVPTLPVCDSLRRISDGMIIGYPDRDEYRAVQTPQGFLREEILSAYRLAREDGTVEKGLTDDSEIYGRYIGAPHTVEGEEGNRKITYPSDLLGVNVKAGFGYDLHVFGGSRPLVLGGVEIPYERKIKAHSDGDVMLHALIDALLSAAGERDIGTLFPDTDEKYDGANSIELLKEVTAILRKKNLSVRSVSLTAVADSPRLSPYIFEIKNTVSAALSVPVTLVNVAAKTTEGTSPDTVSCYAVVCLD